MRTRTLLLTAAAAVVALGGQARAGDPPGSYWALWSVNTGDVLGNVTVRADGGVSDSAVSTNAVGAVNDVTLTAISTNHVVVQGPVLSQTVTTTAGDMIAGQNAFQQGINLAQVQIGGIGPGGQPQVVAYALNTGDVNASVSVRSGGSISHMCLSTNAVGAVNSAVVTSTTTQTVKVGSD